MKMEGNTFAKTPTGVISSAKPEEQEQGAVRSYQQELIDNDGLNNNYTEIRKVIIALTSDMGIRSVYRQVNSRHIPDRHDSIGASCTSVRQITSNAKEMVAYMPSLIGCSANDMKFSEKVTKWFNNMAIPVPPDGKELDCSFQWERKQDYIDYKQREEAIISEYEKADKSNSKLLKEAVNVYVTKLTGLESTRYQYGRPVNLDHYLAYRHCLLYPDVAKDILMVHFNPAIRFYIKDEEREKARLKRVQIQANKARRNYLDAIDNPVKFRAIFVCYCANNQLNVIDNLLLDETIQQKMLDDFSIKEPEKFNKLFNNNNLKVQAFIEEAIAKGELVRSEVNQTVLSPEGAFIGANMKEAIAYFSNPENADYKKALETKIKL